MRASLRRIPADVPDQDALPADVVVAPDDVEGIRAALQSLHGRFLDGGIPSVELAGDTRERLSRRARVEDTAALLRKIVS